MIILLVPRIVQNYLEITHEEVIKAYKHHMSTLINFSPKVREYLKNELGPVSAFKNSKQKNKKIPIG